MSGRYSPAKGTKSERKIEKDDVVGNILVEGGTYVGNKLDLGVGNKLLPKRQRRRDAVFMEVHHRKEVRRSGARARMETSHNLLLPHLL